MIKLFRNSFKILGNNLIFIQPILFLMIILSTSVAYMTVNSIMPVPARIIAVLSLFLLTVAFSAGWFYINKFGIEDFDETDSKEQTVIKSVKNFKKFFEGTGEGFIKVLLSYILIFVVYIAVFFAIAKILVHFSGVPFFVKDFSRLMTMTSNEEIFNYLNGISDKDKLIFFHWAICANIAASILNYISTLHFAALYFDKRNVIVSFFKSIKFFFRNIVLSTVIIVYTYFLYSVLNILALLSGAGSFGFVLLLFFSAMYLNYYLNLVFLFYCEKSKNDSNNGTELVG